MKDLAARFKALADPVRLRLLQALRVAELNVGELVEVLALQQSRISRHLAVLRGAGLVQVRHVGPASYHRVTPEAEVASLWREIEVLLEQDSERAAVADSVRRAIARRAAPSRAFFDTVGAGYDAMRISAGEDVEVRALEALLPRDMRLCDVGTGTGVLLPALARSARAVVAINRSDAMLAAARRRVAELGLDNVDFRVGELEALPLADGEMDGAFANMVLHHAPDPRAAVREMARVVRTKGRVVVIDLCSHKEEWLRDQQADLWLGFEPDDVAAWMRAAGIAGVELERTAYLTPRGELRSFVARGVRA